MSVLMFHLKCLLAGMLCVVVVGRVSGRMETRLYSYQDVSAEEVEAQIRRYVPEGPRVLVDAELQQVMVVADGETHRQVAQLLERIDQPTAWLQFWVRHNRDAKGMELVDGGLGTLPVSATPPGEVVEDARERLSPDRRGLPVVGSVLQVHAVLLSREPPRARLRITPAVTFGVTPPYETAVYHELSTDVMVDTENFLDVTDALSGNDFYQAFLRTQPEAEHPPRLVGLLISFEGIRFGEGEEEEGD